MILDTDTISYFLRGSQSVKDKFKQYQNELASTTINYAELMYGLRKRDNKKYLPKVEMIFNNIKIYDFDKKSANIFSRLKADMQSRGIVIADMDLMIASISIANNDRLISNNLRHFGKIPGLNVESWSKDN